MNDDLDARLRDEAPEADDLLPALRGLRQWPAPAASPADTARLLARLQPALRAHVRERRRAAAAWPWLLLRAQARVVQREIWLGSALVMALGALVAAATFDAGTAGGALPLVFTAPLVAALGAAYLFGPDGPGSLEVELAAPVNPRLVLLARLVLLFAIDLVLGLAASLALRALHTDLQLWPLVQTWLAPMACLSALAFLLSVLCMDATAAAVVSLALWGLQMVRITGAGQVYGWLLGYIPDLFRPGAQVWLWAVALALALAAVWVGGREERWMRRAA
jgi:hypothetical protein